MEASMIPLPTTEPLPTVEPPEGTLCQSGG
jgi:hypothetical protein